MYLQVVLLVKWVGERSLSHYTQHKHTHNRWPPTLTPPALARGCCEPLGMGWVASALLLAISLSPAPETSGFSHPVHFLCTQCHLFWKPRNFQGWSCHSQARHSLSILNIDQDFWKVAHQGKMEAGHGH